MNSQFLKIKNLFLLVILSGAILLAITSERPSQSISKVNFGQVDNLDTSTSGDMLADLSVLEVQDVPPITKTFKEPVKYLSISTSRQQDFVDATFQYIDKQGKLTESIPVLEGEENMIDDSGIFHSELIILPAYVTTIQINNATGDIEVYPVPNNALSDLSKVQDDLANTSADYDVTNKNGTGSADSYYTKKLFENMGINIVTRREWITTEYDVWGQWYFDTYRIVVHHTAGNPGNDIQSYTEYMRAMYYYHSVTKNWRDIGYNYVVAPDGTIFEGHSGGVGARGTHAIPNSGTIGISVMGDYQSGQPPQAALDSLAKLIGALGQVNDIEPVYYDTVVWHNLHDVQLNGGAAPTACAGQYLIAKIDDVSYVARDYYLSSTSLDNNRNLVNQKLNLFGRSNVNGDPARVIIDLTGKDPTIIEKIIDDEAKYTVQSFNNNIATLSIPSELLHQTLSEFYLILGDMPTQIGHMGYTNF